jgi:hypothetical protein
MALKEKKTENGRLADRNFGKRAKMKDIAYDNAICSSCRNDNFGAC